MAHDFGIPKVESSGLKRGSLRPLSAAGFEQAVDDLCVAGGNRVDTKYCVRPDSCICQITAP